MVGPWSDEIISMILKFITNKNKVSSINIFHFFFAIRAQDKVKKQAFITPLYFSVYKKIYMLNSYFQKDYIHFLPVIESLDAQTVRYEKSYKYHC